MYFSKFDRLQTIVLFILLFFLLISQNGMLIMQSWIYLLFKYLDLVAEIVCLCVMGYFVTFNICFNAILNALTIMIDNYLTLLNNMIQYMTSYPTILYLSVDVFICMICTTIIIYILSSHRIFRL